MKITLVGAGNTGTVLGKLIKNSGHEIVQVISRTPRNAQALATQLGCRYGILEDQQYEDADLYIICLADSAMHNIENLPALKNKFIVHTAGALSTKVLEPFSDTYGVLYPLQTLSKYVDDIPEVPFMVDASNQETLQNLTQFAMSLSPMVIPANDDQRIGYHIATVFASNFANHMFALGEIYCQKNKLDFKNLHPIIKETCQRACLYSPFLTQTGPAIRNDVFTMTKHLNILSKYEDMKYMYLKLTENILKLHGQR